jgi:hypothetical protein
MKTELTTQQYQPSLESNMVRDIDQTPLETAGFVLSCVLSLGLTGLALEFIRSSIENGTLKDWLLSEDTASPEGLLYTSLYLAATAISVAGAVSLFPH